MKWKSRLSKNWWENGVKAMREQIHKGNVEMKFCIACIHYIPDSEKIIPTPTCSKFLITTVDLVSGEERSHYETCANSRYWKNNRVFCGEDGKFFEPKNFTMTINSNITK